LGEVVGVSFAFNDDIPMKRTGMITSKLTVHLERGIDVVIGFLNHSCRSGALEDIQNSSFNPN
jgi:hypothetical protein